MEVFIAYSSDGVKIFRKFHYFYFITFISAKNYDGGLIVSFFASTYDLYIQAYILPPSLYLFKHCIFDCCFKSLFKIRLYMKSSRVVHGLILMCTSMFLDNFVRDNSKIHREMSVHICMNCTKIKQLTMKRILMSIKLLFSSFTLYSVTEF